MLVHDYPQERVRTDSYIEEEHVTPIEAHGLGKIIELLLPSRCLATATYVYMLLRIRITIFSNGSIILPVSNLRSYILLL